MHTASTSAIARCFDKAADTYDKHAQIQQKACHYLLNLLPHHTATQIIDLGCGTGFSTRSLRKPFPNSWITGIDISERSLQQARQIDRFSKYERGDFNNLAPCSTHYDLIFANMALQWSNNLTKTFSLLKHRLESSGLLAFSIPLSATFNNLQPCDIQPMPTNDNIKQSLKLNGLHCIESHQTNWHQPYRSVLHALRAIKATGANYTNKRGTSRTCRQWLRSQLKTNSVQPFDLHYQLGFYIARSA